MFPDRDIFIKELEGISNKDLQERILNVYDNAVLFKELDSPRDYSIAILKELFNPHGLYQDIAVPLSFQLESNIGKVLFQVINNNEKLYSIAELLELTKTEKKPEGLTKSLISKDIKLGKLKGIMKGKNYYFTEEEVKNYLKSKNIEV